MFRARIRVKLPKFSLLLPFLTLLPLLYQPISCLSILSNPPLQDRYIHNETRAIAPLLLTHSNTCILPLSLSSHFLSLLPSPPLLFPSTPAWSPSLLSLGFLSRDLPPLPPGSHLAETVQFSPIYL